MVMTCALVVASEPEYSGEPPAVRIFPATASYMTAIPHIESGSVPRSPAAVVLPVEAVPYQFIALLGPAWKTEPFFHPKSQP